MIIYKLINAKQLNKVSLINLFVDLYNKIGKKEL